MHCESLSLFVMLILSLWMGHPTSLVRLKGVAVTAVVSAKTVASQHPNPIVVPPALTCREVQVKKKMVLFTIPAKGQNGRARRPCPTGSGRGSSRQACSCQTDARQREAPPQCHRPVKMRAASNNGSARSASGRDRPQLFVFPQLRALQMEPQETSASENFCLLPREVGTSEHTLPSS